VLQYSGSSVECAPLETTKQAVSVELID